MVSYLADQVAVMYLGRIVEQGPAEEVFTDPKHPYTQGLLKSVPKAEGGQNDFVPVKGELPSPANPPKAVGASSTAEYGVPGLPAIFKAS